jgi:hypothetical protein
MNTSLIIDKIINEIRPLDDDTKIRLIEKILGLIKSNEKKKKPAHSLSDLKALGADIWLHEDITEYIKNERKWD